jgi:WG containing repeat
MTGVIPTGWRRALALLAGACAIGSALAAEPSWPLQTLHFERHGNRLTIRNAQSGALVAKDVDGFFPRDHFAIVWCGGKRGVIGEDGRLLVPIEYDDIKDRDGARVFEVKRGNHWGLLGYDGSVRLPVEYDDIYDYRHSGQPWVIKRAGMKGAVDPVSGRVVLPLKYDDVLMRPPFMLAATKSRADRGESKNWFAFDLTGRPIPGVAAAEKLEVWRSESLLVVNAARVVDAAGKTVIAAGRFDAISPAGKAAIVRHDGCYGLINAAGEALTSVCYMGLWPNNNELITARVAHGGKQYTGIMDDQGKVVVEPQWDYVERNTIRREGKEPVTYYVVSRDDKWGSVDAAGKEIFPPRFDDAQKLSHDDPVYYVSKGKLNGLCDFSLGTCPIRVAYSDLHCVDDPFLDDELYIARRNGKLGVIAVGNATVIPFAYDQFKVVRRHDLKPGDLKPGDIEAHKGLVTTRFRLERDADNHWRANVAGGSAIGDQHYDLNPAAVKERPVLDARYLPDGLLTDAQVLAAARAGRLRGAVFPSIQIADSRAYVNFDQFTHAGKAVRAPTMTVCREANGFRLVPTVGRSGNVDTACAGGGARGLRFHNDGEAALRCKGCARLGLPTHWRFVAAAPRNACPAMATDWSATKARREYAEWLARFEREAPRWLAPIDDSRRSARGQIDDLRTSVDTSSRAIGELAMMSLQPQRLAGLVDDDLKADIPWSSLGLRLIALLRQAEPAGFGGIYPESDDHYAHVCAEVWYLRLPAVEAAVAAGARIPGFSAYSLPRAGAFRRRAYPFVTFTRHKYGDRGIRLAGISREFLRAWLWLESRRKSPGAR